MDFSCAPRLGAPPLDVGDIVVESPPDVPRPAPANPLEWLLPAAMLVAALGMALLYFTSGATRSPMFMMFPVMMLVSVIGSLAYGSHGARRTGELDQDRREYLRYLDALDDATVRTADAQHLSMHWSHPDPGSLWTLVGGKRMWERRPDDADFCQVRIGLGTLGLSTRLIAPESTSSESCDPVTADALHRLMTTRSTVSNLPVTVDVRKQSRITIDGDVAAARGLARAMICQLAVLHGPQYLKIAAVVADVAAPEWEWLKWLPHHVHSPFHDTAQVVVLVDGRDVPGDPLADHVTTLVIGTGEAPLPATPEQRDAMSPVAALTCARRLAAFRIGSPTTAGPPRALGGWAALNGVGDVEHLDTKTCWRDRTGSRRLRVAIGVSDAGETVELDIKEAAHGGMGPHGLCVGATGSGKSEFLRTLALGLVATHPPDALNLVLVDFKGGATFLGFERLQHVAAVITNLSDEAHLVARMRDALAGEMTRRQQALRAAGNYANVTDYAAARAAGATLPPLPVLFIVVDEFSELLSQQPDFADLFTAIGRVGRSLGMHLLLASQRLDEGRLRGLENHLSYRICLKTFSAAESRGVLATSDAYDLPSTPGTAYLKTASGKLVRFRTSFVSCPAPRAAVQEAGQNTCTPALFTARPAAPDPVEVQPDGPDLTTPTILDTVLDGLAGQGTPAHRVWSPPLVESPALNAVLLSGLPPLTVPIGLVDKPFEQRRDPLIADLSGSGGHAAIVGGPRSGKSTALRTLVLALAAAHSPERVQIYGLDFGGGVLASTRVLAHVGAVAGRFDAALVRRIVGQLQALVRTREARLRSDGVDAGFDDAYGDVFLVVDGWAAIRQDFDGLEEAITTLAMQGLAVGVHVVVTATRWVEIRPALKDQLGTRIELRLGDPADSEMDRRKARLLGDCPPGRGITRDGLDMVIALPRLDGRSSNAGLDDALRDADELLRARQPDAVAPAVELLPTVVTADAVAAAASSALPPAHVLIGVGEDDLRPVAVDFGGLSHLVVLGETECGKTTTLRTLCRELVRTNSASHAQILIVDPRRSLLGVVESDHLAGYAMSAAAAETHVATMARIIQSRMPGTEVTQRQLRERSWWSGPEMYVVVDDYDLVAEAAPNPLSALLDLLPHSRDLGLHVVVARRSGGAARAMFDPLLARLRDLGCMGLTMSAGPDDGVLLGSVRPTTQPPGRGTLSRRGQPNQVVQVSWTDPP
ncbi:type VII secretion protein EccCa [Mycolicibacterium sp. P9-64]|uniref:type VII secretion protein EccCa n=1 Tax=Mycolicibacterium sp. P9-64 TaxID=2024612 RepID=UPI0011EDF4BC|nr:type VII secretion protein EccCa [Mycolicibacterium sp. P9-64]KAA0075671.1 type VII secretion protein EccCa [Mycolicibacterium sp. P9-64]